MTFAGKEVLDRFLDGSDRSMETLTFIEAALDEDNPSDEVVRDFVLDVAMYRPGGGEFLLDEEQMLGKVRRILNYLASKHSRS